MARRYFVDPLPAPGPSRLPAEIAHHVGSVLRARIGSILALSDGRGRHCQAEIIAISRKGLDVRCGPTVTGGRDLPVRIEVAFAAPKGTRCDWLFEHGTEVGVQVFRPILTARSTDQDSTGANAARLARWRRIVAAAAGQCDRLWLPEVREVQSLTALLGQPDLPAERYLAGAADETLQGAVGDRVLVLVGPEGGFTPEEVAAATAAGCLPRNLGALTLRTETAVIAGTVRLTSALSVSHGSTWSRSSAKL